MSSISILCSGRIAEKSTTSTTPTQTGCARSADTGEVIQRIYLLYYWCLKPVSLLSEVMCLLSCRSLEIIWAQIENLSATQSIAPIVKLLRKCVPQWTLAIQMGSANKVNAFATRVTLELTVEKRLTSWLTISTKNSWWMVLRASSLSLEKAFIPVNNTNLPSLLSSQWIFISIQFPIKAPYKLSQVNSIMLQLSKIRTKLLSLAISSLLFQHSP